MDEQRKHAILFAATLLSAKKLMTALEQEAAAEDLQREHYVWRAIEQANRILEKIDQRWPGKSERGCPEGRGP